MRIFFIGICGISMSALAFLSLKRGNLVSGSDLNFEDKPKCLDGISVFPQPCLAEIEKADLVVYSSAITPSHHEFIYAKNLGKKMISRGEYLFEISKNFEKTIAVAGSHGKTTTTAMIFHTLWASGKRPSLHLGGILQSEKMQTCLDGDEFFVTEACEYFDNFLHLRPAISVITNVEPEHLDYFKNFANQKKSFEEFEKNSDICIKKPFFKAKNIRLNKLGCVSFDLCDEKQKIQRIQLRIGGKYNAQNALFCIDVCRKIGLSMNQIKFGLETFKGVKKRCEKIDSCFDFPLFVDYAHHPKEIEKVAGFFKKINKGKTIAVFQPHTYSRTKDFFDEFVESLSLFDEIILFKTFPAREKKIDGLCEKDLCQRLKIEGKTAFVFYDMEILKSFLFRYDEKCLVAFLGAGDLPDKFNFDA